MTDTETADTAETAAIDPDTLYAHLKQLVALLAAGSVGFWAGGNYAAATVLEKTNALVLQGMAWKTPVENTLWLAIIACGVAVLGWIVLDYRDHN